MEQFKDLRIVRQLLPNVVVFPYAYGACQYRVGKRDKQTAAVTRCVFRTTLQAKASMP